MADWSPTEVAATVADYLAMLELELHGTSYNKSEHDRQLRAGLNGRSAGAIEFHKRNRKAFERLARLAAQDEDEVRTGSILVDDANDEDADPNPLAEGETVADAWT